MDNLTKESMVTDFWSKAVQKIFFFFIYEYRTYKQI